MNRTATDSQWQVDPRPTITRPICLHVPLSALSHSSDSNTLHLTTLRQGGWGYHICMSLSSVDATSVSLSVSLINICIYIYIYINNLRKVTGYLKSVSAVNIIINVVQWHFLFFVVFYNFFSLNCFKSVRHASKSSYWKYIFISFLIIFNNRQEMFSSFILYLLDLICLLILIGFC